MQFKVGEENDETGNDDENQRQRRKSWVTVSRRAMNAMDDPKRGLGGEARKRKEMMTTMANEGL